MSTCSPHGNARWRSGSLARARKASRSITAPYHRGLRVSDVALFDKALMGVECVVAATYPGGDHVLLLGEVRAVKQNDSLRATVPLLFSRSALHTLQLESVAPERSCRAESHKRAAYERSG